MIYLSLLYIYIFLSNNINLIVHPCLRKNYDYFFIFAVVVRYRCFMYTFYYHNVSLNIVLINHHYNIRRAINCKNCSYATR